MRGLVALRRLALSTGLVAPSVFLLGDLPPFVCENPEFGAPRCPRVVVGEDVCSVGLFFAMEGSVPNFSVPCPLFDASRESDWPYESPEIRLVGIESGEIGRSPRSTNSTTKAIAARKMMTERMRVLKRG